jgi:hypothetical protein
MNRIKKEKSSQIPPNIRDHFQAQSESGKTFREYSISVGISPLTFYGWRKKYAKDFITEFGKKSSSPKLKPQTFTTFPAHMLQRTDQPLFDIYFNDNLKVRLYHGVDAQQFAPYYKLLCGGNPVC